jgi:hypothetical protein
MHYVTNVQRRKRSPYNKTIHSPTLLICARRAYKRMAGNFSLLHLTVQS